MDQESKCKTGNHKLLEENLGETCFDINRHNIFLDQSPKAIEIKAKIKIGRASCRERV